MGRSKGGETEKKGRESRDCERDYRGTGASSVLQTPTRAGKKEGAFIEKAQWGGGGCGMREDRAK